jgi:hypothetical protein
MVYNPKDADALARALTKTLKNLKALLEKIVCLKM